MVAFGPDGALYVGMGDGGSGGDPHGYGQSDGTLLGKMVRVELDANGEPGQPQIWDKGLRNPWRFSFDRETGDLWISDVGQGRRRRSTPSRPASGSATMAGTSWRVRPTTPRPTMRPHRPDAARGCLQPRWQ